MFQVFVEVGIESKKDGVAGLRGRGEDKKVGTVSRGGLEVCIKEVMSVEKRKIASLSAQAESRAGPESA